MSELPKAAERLREHSIELGCAGPHGLEEFFALAARVLAAVEKVERMRFNVCRGYQCWYVQQNEEVVSQEATWLECVEAVPVPAKGEEA